MTDTNKRGPNESHPDSAATSSETLEDLEKNEKDDASQSKGDSGKGAAPSPDGTGDTPRDRPDDAGPM